MKRFYTCSRWLHMNQRRSREFVLVNATFRYIWCWNVCTVFFFKLTSCSFFQLFTNILVVNFYLELSPVTCNYNYFFISSINVHMYYLQSGFKYCTRIHSLSMLHLYFSPLYIGFYKTFNLVIARYKMWLILNILQIYCVLECMHDIMNAVILNVTMNGNKSYMYLRLIKVLIFYL